MNPFCSNHDPPVMMRTVERDTMMGLDENTLKPHYGRSKYWECPRCKVKYKKGHGIIPKAVVK